MRLHHEMFGTPPELLDSASSVSGASRARSWIAPTRRTRFWNSQTTAFLLVRPVVEKRVLGRDAPELYASAALRLSRAGRDSGIHRRT